MATDLGTVRIPSRLEPLKRMLETDGAWNVSQVLIQPQEDDLAAVRQGIVSARSSGQSKLLFLRGAPGVGKTSLVHAAQVFSATEVAEVITPPPEFRLPLSDLARWLDKEVVPRVPQARGRMIFVNLDKREVPQENTTQSQAAMTNLNAFLRDTPGMLLLWPVSERSFAEASIGLLSKTGGASALSQNPIHEVKGIEKGRYLEVLNLVLSALDAKLEDAAITWDEAEALKGPSDNIGRFLEEVNALAVQRYDLGKLIAPLPEVTFVISGPADPDNLCQLLRRASRYLVDADRLLKASSANVKDRWVGRAQASGPRHALPFVCSAFNVRLVSVSGSAVVNACALSESPDIVKLVKDQYPKPVSSNAKNTMEPTTLAKLLQGQAEVIKAMTRNPPGPDVRKAFLALQEVSKKSDKHRAINEAIVRKVLVERMGLSLPKLDFEVEPLRTDGKALRVDAWFWPEGARPRTLEFTHRLGNDEEDVSPAVVARYIMEKLEAYALDYGIISA